MLDVLYAFLIWLFVIVPLMLLFALSWDGTIYTSTSTHTIREYDRLPERERD